MKPSFPQKPPLLVQASTCLTTWRETAVRLPGPVEGDSWGAWLCSMVETPTWDVFPEHLLMCGLSRVLGTQTQG